MTSPVHAGLVSLSLLRKPSLHVREDRPPVELSRKDAALLAMLALDGAIARDGLAQMLWPAVDLGHARASLRQRRYRLRQIAGAPLIVGEDRLALSDLVRHDASDPDARLAQAPDGLDGDLLEGLSFHDCPEVARWLDTARERWQVMRQQALGRMAGRFEAEGRIASAIGVAQRLAVERPLSDHVHRQLMRLHYLRGDLGSAMDVFRRFANRLASELGELPDDETAALAASLRLGQAPTRAPTPVPPPTLRRPPRLIGRDTAWSVLQQGLAGRTPVVVEGAPGVGKTRLVTDFAADADASMVLLVSALGGDAQRPFALLARLLSRLWLDPQALRPTGPAALPEWARHELAALLPELGAGPPQMEALRVQRAVQAAIQGAGLSLVVLDDVQFADAATLELLPACTGAGMPCWVMAGRAGELPSPLGAWLQASDPPRHLVLRPLDVPEIATLLQDLALQGFEAATWADRLARHTGGLPLFLLETLRALSEQPGRATLPALPTPATAAQAIRARAAHLPEAARQLAHAAAVLQQPLPVEAGAALLGGQPADWLGAFALLEAAQWLDARGAMHDLVCAALYEGMPAAERRWLHGNVARWLVQAGAGAEDAARHFAAAGQEAQAAQQFEAGAARARRASRPTEEADLWERAAAMWERAGRHDRAFAAWRNTSRPVAFARGPGEAMAVAERLIEMARTPGEQAVALGALGAQLVVASRTAEALPGLQQALTITEQTGDARSGLDLTIILAHALCASGRAQEALAALRKSSGRWQPFDLRQRVDYLDALARACFHTGRLDECLTAIRESLSVTEARADWSAATRAAGNLTLILVDAGLLEAALTAAARALENMHRLGPARGYPISQVEVQCGRAFMFTGRLAAALSACERAVALCQAHAVPGRFAIEAIQALATCHLLRGDAALARQVLRAAPAERPAEQTLDVERCLLQAAIAAALSEDPADWLRQARTAADEAAQPQSPLAIMVDAETLILGPGRDDAQALHLLEQQARALQRGALATRLAWHRVDALRRSGRAAEAARRARELLAQPLWPSMMLPCHWLRMAQAALAAAGDPETAAVTQQALTARQQTEDELARPAGPVAPRCPLWPAAAPSSAPRPRPRPVTGSMTAR